MNEVDLDSLPEIGNDGSVDLDSLPEVDIDSLPEIDLDSLPEIEAGSSEAEPVKVEEPAPVERQPKDGATDSYDISSIPRGMSQTIDMANDVAEEAQRRAAEEPKFATRAERRSRTVAGTQASVYGAAPSMEGYDASVVDSITDTNGNVAKRGEIVGVDRGDGTSRLYEFTGDDENGHPTLRRLTEDEAKGKNAKASMSGDVFRRMRGDGRIKMDSSAIEQVRQGVLSETGREDVYGEGALGQLAAVATRAVPYIGRANADRYKWQLQKLDEMSRGDFGGKDYIWLYKSGIFDDDKVNVIRTKDESEEDWQKRMQAAASDELKKRVTAMQDAEEELGATDKGAWDKILGGFIDSSGYALEFAVPGGVVGKGWKIAKGGSELARLGKAAFRQNVVSTPVTLAEASSRYTEMKTPGFALDEDGNPYIRDMADSTGKAALKAIGGALFDTNVEVGLEPVVMGIFRLGKRKAGMAFDKWTPQLMEGLAKNYGKFAHSSTGRLMHDFAKAYGEFADVTAINSPLGELAEEDVQALERVFNIEGKDSQYGGFADEWRRFKNDQMSVKTQFDTFLGLVGQLLVGSATSAYRANKYRNSEEYQEGLKQERDLKGVLRLANVDEDTINTLSPEQMAVLGDMWKRYSANPEELKKNTRGLGLALRAAGVEMANRDGVRMDETLRAEGMEPAKFVFSTDENGNPAFKHITRLHGDNSTEEMDAMSSGGVTIVDTHDGKFAVMNDWRGSVPEIKDDFESARAAADNQVMLNQRMDAENSKKTEYFEKYVAPNYDGRKIHVAQTVQQLREEVLQAVTSGEGYFGTNDASSIFDETGELHEKSAGGFHTPDGTTVLILDNIVSPADMERVTAHEAVGHEGVENQVGRDNLVEFIGGIRANEFSNYAYGQWRKMTQNLIRHGFSTEEAQQIAVNKLDSDRGRKEIMAKYAEQRRHMPTAKEQAQHDENEKRRASGENVPQDDADLEVMLWKAEQDALQKRDDAAHTKAKPVVQEFETEINRNSAQVDKETPETAETGQEKTVESTEVVQNAQNAEQSQAQENAPVSAPSEKGTTSRPEAEKPAEAENGASDGARQKFLSELGEFATEGDRQFADVATDEEFEKANELRTKARDSGKDEDVNALSDFMSGVVTKADEASAKANETAGVKPTPTVRSVEDYVTAKPDMSDAEKSALTEAVKKVGDETDEMQIAGDKGILGSLLKRGPLMLLDPQKVDTSDEELPNFKLGVDRKTGIRTPLEGKWMPSLAGFGVVWLRSDGKLVQATGRHRNQKAREANEPMWNVVLRESDGWTKEKMALIDGTFNIKDGKGDVADYVRFFEDSGFDRKDAEDNGLLSDKGLVAWSIYADATDATRAATDLTGSGEEGKITPEQASIIAQAAPKGANPRNGLIQSVLLRKAQAGKRGEAFRGYARMMANDLRSSKANANLTEGQQMDLFMNDPEVMAIDALNEKRSAYMMKKSGEFADQANLLRTAITRGTKLELRPEAAKALGIEDANDKEQLKAAYDKALHLSDYWNPAKDHILDEADKSAMDAEINAKADANAKKRAELKAKLAAVKSGKPLPKKAVSKKETTVPSIESVKSAIPVDARDGLIKVSADGDGAITAYYAPGSEEEVARARTALKEKFANADVMNAGTSISVIPSKQKKPTTPEKSSEVEKPSTPRKRTVVMKNAEEEAKAKAALDKIEFDTDLFNADATVLSGDEIRKRMPGYDRLDWRTHVDRDNSFVAPRMEAQFRHLLKTRKGKGDGSVVILAGGNGAGKSTVAGARVATADFIIDSTLGNIDVARKHIDAILANGQDVVIEYVYRPPSEALMGVVNRAKNGGHLVSPASFANSHAYTRKNLLLLADEYNGKILVEAYENSNGTIKEISLDELSKKPEVDREKLKRSAEYIIGTAEKGFKAQTGTGQVDSRGASAGGARGSGKQEEVDFSTEFDYEKFGRLVTGVGKLVDVLTESGHKDFKALATFISERDAEKYKRAKAVLQDVWNAVARQKGLERVSDAQADEIFGIIDKEAEDGTVQQSQQSDGNRGGALDNAQAANDAQPVAEEAARGEGVRSGKNADGSDLSRKEPDEQRRDVGDDARAVHSPVGGAAGRGGSGKGVKDSSADRGNDRPSVSVQQGEGKDKQSPASNGVDAGTQGREGGLDAEGRRGHSERKGGESDGRAESDKGGNASGSVKRAAKKAVEKTGPVYTDFVMTPAVEEAILERSPIKRVRNNIAAIKLLQELKERDFKATPSEQEVLAKYVGWGGLSEMFSWDYERAWEAEKRGDTDDAKDYAKGAKYGAEGYEAYKEIRQTLNDEEYAAAKETVLTAFYTPIQMVRLEHEALRKLGVVGGRFLGPSAGVGNYASAAGNYPKGANWQFVEKDQVSGQILRSLFPNQRVYIGGYEETKLADSFFDFAIDNVPYADIDITDKSVSKSPYKIHDYFFAKTLSKVRPGGVIMFLTSTGTLDKTDGKLRQFLSQHGGKIVGAVRLPNGFFSKNAGTDVASDLVIIQRVNGEADNTGFMEQQKYGTDMEWVRRKGRVQVDLTYNKYFADNPGQVIGEMKVGSGQYGRTMLEYKMPKGDIFAKVGEAIDNALSGIDREALMKNAPAIEQKDHAPVYDSEGLRQGNITIKDGKLYEKSGNELVEVEMPKLSTKQKKIFASKLLTPVNVVEKILGVRKALRSVVDAEVNGMDDENLRPLIDNLNEVYDDFVKRVGTFHDKNVTPFIMLDKADGNRLMTMEKVTKVDGNDVIEKADILKKRVIFTYQKPTKADTLADALTISYSEYGYIRWDRIGELMGISADDVGKRLVDEGLAFENPQTGIHEPYWEYLSGHVRRKLEAARAAMQNDPAFAKNVEALEKVQPKDVSLDEVTIKFGNTWVDTDAMIDFLKEMYDIRGYQDVKLTKNETVGKWNLELPHSSVEPFGAISFTQEHFLQAVLNSESLEVRAKDPITEKYYVLERETEAQKLAAEKLHEAFARFLRTSEKWYEPSNRSFNLVMNDNVAMTLPNNILPFRAAGMSEDVIKKLHAEGREYQPAVIARGVLGGKSLCLAHCVGAGKTLEMQSIGMIGRHLGMFKKSMYVVPNHMLDQFCNEFLAAFPNANILKMSTEDVQPKNRRAFFAKVANGDWDAIVVKHSTFSQKLPMTEKWQKDYLEREVRRLTDAKLAAKGDKASAKDIEKMIVRAKEKIKKLDSSDKKDSEIVPFEELGVDQLFVDEAHNFKGLPIVSSQARKVKGLAQGDSQRALDMEMKTQYVQSLHDGKRGVVFATGTPLSNAPVVEAYVNLRYLAPWAMEEQGISSFDDFVNTFGRIETESEFGIDGKSTKEVQRVTAFVNIPEMMRLFKSVVDIVNSDQIKVKRPKMVMEAVPVQMSDAQAAIMEMVANESAIPPTKEERSKFLTLSGIAKRACISPRLLGVDDDGSKMIACANKVKQVFDETSDVRGAQLIFTDIFNSSDADGVVKYVGGMDGYTGKKWNLNDHLKELLVRSGIPAEQIGVIHDVDKAKGGDEGKDAAKEALFAKVRSGEIRVLIGSRPRMGEGTNVQERLAAIHLLHPGWKPSEDTQAIGRIIRPGNIFESGKVFYYLTQGNKNIGSYETKNHELIGVKDRLIQAVMHGNETVREIDLDEASAERDMLMGLASANQDLIKLIDVKRVLHKAELNVESVGFSARSNADNATRTERALEKAKEDFAEQERGAKEWREKNKNGSFVLTVPDGRKLDSMKDMAEYVSAQVTKQLDKERYERDERLEIGNFGGVPLNLSCNFADNKIYLSVPSLGYAKEISYSGFLADFSPQAMTAFKGRILSEVSPDMEEAHKQTIADTENRIKRLKADAARFNEEWQKEKEKLTKLRAEKERLERAVTPLLVQTTEDRKYTTYGNWAITKSGSAYKAVRQSDGKEIKAGTVKELLPKMDAEDFSAPGRGANKTIDLATIVNKRGGEDENPVKTVSVEEVDFDTNFNPSDFNGERRFDVVDNGVLHENALRHFTRNGAEGFVKSGKSKFSRDAKVYEHGAWQKAVKNAKIRAHNEKSSSQRRFVNRINPYGEGAAGTVLSRALEAGAANVRTGEEVRRALGKSGSGTLGRPFGALEERTAEKDRLPVSSAWRFYTDGTIVVPVLVRNDANRAKESLRSILANSMAFRNIRLEGFAEDANGDVFAIGMGSRINRIVHPDDAEVESIMREYGYYPTDNRFTSSGVYYVQEDMSMPKVDPETLIFGETAGGKTVIIGGEAYRLKDPVVDFDTNLTKEEEDYANSDDKTPTEKVMREVFGMTNDEIETAMKADELEPKAHVRKSDETKYQQAQVLLSNPSYMEKLARARSRVPVPLRDYEVDALGVLFWQRKEAVNVYREIYNNLVAIPEDERSDEDREMLKQARKDLDEALRLEQEAGAAKTSGASELGRGLRANRDIIDQHDYSFAGIAGKVQAILGKNREIPAEMQDAINKIVDDYKDADEEARAIMASRLKAASENGWFNDTKKSLKNRKAGERKVGDEGKLVTRNYLDALAQIETQADRTGGSLVGMSDQMYPSWGKYLKAIGIYHVFMNPEMTEDEVVAKIVEDVQPFLDGIDANQVRDAVTGFGHNYRQSRYESQRAFNDLKAQMLKKRQLDYMNENNELSPLTGMIRDEPSDETRRLAREVQERKKETPEGGANRLKSVLESAKTRVKNRIADLERAIENGEAIPRRERTVREDIDLINLKKRRDELQEQYDAIFGTKSGMTDEQRIKSTEKALAKELERTMDDLARAQAGDFSKRPKRSGVSSATIEALRDEIERRRQEIFDLKKAAYEFGLTPAEIAERNARKIQAREAAIMRMAERIEKGDVRPMKKPQPPMTADEQKRYDALGKVLKDARAKMAALREQAAEATRPGWVQKGIHAGSTALAAQRLFLATLDLSAFGKQGAAFWKAHPELAAKAMKTALSATKDDSRMAEIRDELMSDPDVQEAVSKFGLHLRETASKEDVEMFKDLRELTIAGKGVSDIPLLGELMLKSERHYITYLNAISVAMYTSIINDRTRFPGGATNWQKQQICDLVNMYNGSGAMSKKRRQNLNSGIISKLYWAPGLLASRLQSVALYDVWHPLVVKGYQNAEGEWEVPTAKERLAMTRLALRERMRTSAATVALGVLFLMLKSMFDDGDELDKFKRARFLGKTAMLMAPTFFNTTLDFSGGSVQYVRLLDEIISGKRTTGTGRTQELGSYGVPSASDLVLKRLVRYKASPFVGLVLNMIDRKQLNGEKYGFWPAVRDMLVPLSIQDIYDQATNNPLGVLPFTAAATLLGIAGQTYDRKPYENAVNPFLEAKKEYDAVATDMKMDREERKSKLKELESENPLLSGRARMEISSALKSIKTMENDAKKFEKSTGRANEKLLEQVDKKKQEVLEKIRKYRR